MRAYCNVVLYLLLYFLHASKRSINVKLTLITDKCSPYFLFIRLVNVIRRLWLYFNQFVRTMTSYIVIPFLREIFWMRRLVSLHPRLLKIKVCGGKQWTQSNLFTLLIHRLLRDVNVNFIYIYEWLKATSVYIVSNHSTELRHL